MTRAECEKKLAKKMREIRKIYLQYNPDGDFLDITLKIKDGYMSCFNSGYDKTSIDAEKPIDFYSLNEVVNDG